MGRLIGIMLALVVLVKIVEQGAQLGAPGATFALMLLCLFLLVRQPDRAASLISVIATILFLLAVFTVPERQPLRWDLLVVGILFLGFWLTFRRR
jgi:predicted membrane protein